MARRGIKMDQFTKAIGWIVKFMGRGFWLINMEINKKENGNMVFEMGSLYQRSKMGHDELDFIKAIEV